MWHTLIVAAIVAAPFAFIYFTIRLLVTRRPK